MDENSLFHYNLLINSTSTPAIVTPDISTDTRVTANSGGYEHTLIAKTTVKGGILAMTPFLSEYYGALSVIINSNRTLQLELKFTHYITLGDGTVVPFTSTRTHEQRLVKNVDTTLPFALFDSNTMVRTGTFTTQDGTSLTLTQEDLDRDLDIELKVNFKFLNNSHDPQTTTITAMSGRNLAVWYRQYANLTQGQQGAQGGFYLRLYTASETKPTKPTALTYDLANDVFAVTPNTWTHSIPAITGNERVWVIEAPLDPAQDDLDGSTSLLSKLGNIVAFTGERGAQGQKGDTGDPGQSVKGDKGDKGDTGASVKGDQGDPGQDGVRGSKWFTGTTVPTYDSAEHLEGDFYLNSTNGDYYQLVGTTWTKQGSLKGQKGDPGADGTGGGGSGVLSGTRPPIASDGEDGNYWIEAEGNGNYLAIWENVSGDWVQLGEVRDNPTYGLTKDDVNVLKAIPVTHTYEDSTKMQVWIRDTSETVETDLPGKSWALSQSVTNAQHAQQVYLRIPVADKDDRSILGGHLIEGSNFGLAQWWEVTETDDDTHVYYTPIFEFSLVEASDHTFKWQDYTTAINLGGDKGDKGDKGLQGSFYLRLYTASVDQPSQPTALTYDLANDIVAVTPNTWTLSTPAVTGSERVWVIEARLDPSEGNLDGSVNLLSKLGNIVQFSGLRGLPGSHGDAGRGISNIDPDGVVTLTDGTITRLSIPEAVLSREDRKKLNAIRDKSEWVDAWTVSPDPRGIDAPTHIDYDVLLLASNREPSLTDLDNSGLWANREPFTAEPGDYIAYLRAPKDVPIEGRMLMNNATVRLTYVADRLGKLGDEGEYSFYRLNVLDRLDSLVITFAEETSIRWQFLIITDVNIIPDGGQDGQHLTRRGKDGLAWVDPPMITSGGGDDDGDDTHTTGTFELADDTVEPRHVKANGEKVAFGIPALDTDPTKFRWFSLPELQRAEAPSGAQLDGNYNAGRSFHFRIDNNSPIDFARYDGNFYVIDRDDHVYVYDDNGERQLALEWDLPNNFSLTKIIQTTKDNELILDTSSEIQFWNFQGQKDGDRTITRDREYYYMDDDFAYAASNAIYTINRSTGTSTGGNYSYQIGGNYLTSSYMYYDGSKHYWGSSGLIQEINPDNLEIDSDNSFSIDRTPYRFIMDDNKVYVRSGVVILIYDRHLQRQSSADYSFSGLYAGAFSITDDGKNFYILSNNSLDIHKTKGLTSEIQTTFEAPASCRALACDGTYIYALASVPVRITSGGNWQHTVHVMDLNGTRLTSREFQVGQHSSYHVWDIAVKNSRIYYTYNNVRYRVYTTTLADSLGTESSMYMGNNSSSNMHIALGDDFIIASYNNSSYYSYIYGYNAPSSLQTGGSFVSYDPSSYYAQSRTVIGNKVYGLIFNPSTQDYTIASWDVTGGGSTQPTGTQDTSYSHILYGQGITSIANSGGNMHLNYGTSVMVVNSKGVTLKIEDRVVASGTITNIDAIGTSIYALQGLSVYSIDYTDTGTRSTINRQTLISSFQRRAHSSSEHVRAIAVHGNGTIFILTWYSNTHYIYQYKNDTYITHQSVGNTDTNVGSGLYNNISISGNNLYIYAQYGFVRVYTTNADNTLSYVGGYRLPLLQAAYSSSDGRQYVYFTPTLFIYSEDTQLIYYFKKPSDQNTNVVKQSISGLSQMTAFKKDPVALDSNFHLERHPDHPYAVAVTDDEIYVTNRNRSNSHVGSVSVYIYDKLGNIKADRIFSVGSANQFTRHDIKVDDEKIYLLDQNAYITIYDKATRNYINRHYIYTSLIINNQFWSPVAMVVISGNVHVLAYYSSSFKIFIFDEDFVLTSSFNIVGTVATGTSWVSMTWYDNNYYFLPEGGQTVAVANATGLVDTSGQWGLINANTTAYGFDTDGVNFFVTNYNSEDLFVYDAEER